MKLNDAEQSVIDEVVHLVMADALGTAASVIDHLLTSVSEHFTTIIAGCTELPLALDRSKIASHMVVVDSNRVLARVLVDAYYRSEQRPAAAAGAISLTS